MRRFLPLLLTLGAACAPPAEEPPCDEGQVEDADTAVCVPEACGTGAWGLLDRDAGTVHVAPWGDDGGDGSEGRPYRTIQRGADEAGEDGGGLVAVAAGTYEENLDLGADHDGVAIAGRCAEMVVIDGSRDTVPGVRASGGQVALAGVAITAGEGGVWVQPAGFGDAHVRLAGVLLEGNGSVALIALGSGAEVDGEDVTIRDTRLGADGSAGLGLVLMQGAALSADRLRVDGSPGAGLVAVGAGTEVDLESSAVLDTQAGPDGTGGVGLTIGDGARLVAGGLVIERSIGIGLLASQGGRVDVQDLEIRETLASPEDEYGRGIKVESGSELAATGVLLEDNSGIGLFAEGLGTEVDIEDAIVRDTRADHEGASGRGIEVQDRARLVGRGLVLDGNRTTGLLASGAGTRAELEESTVRGTVPGTDGLGGRGIEVQSGAALVARGVLLERNRDAGLVVGLDGASADLHDLTVRDTQPGPEGRFGRGVHVQGPASLVAQGLLLEGNRDHGLSADGAGATVDLAGAAIRETQPDGTGQFGSGIALQGGATLLARGLLLEGNHDAGIVAGHAGTRVELEDATIRDTGSRPDGTFGRGIVVQEAATLLATGLLVEGNCDAGLLADGEGTAVELVDATVLATRTATATAGGQGVGVQAGAVLAATGLVVAGNEGPGLYLVADGSLEAWDVSLRGNGFAGAVVIGGGLLLRGGDVSGSTPHPSEGGGVGVFGWSVGDPPSVELDGLAFSDLVGPALYARGPGSYTMRGCTAVGTGTPPWLPGGVLALEGVTRWHEVGDTGTFLGLLLQGNTFASLPGDAVLLDASSATLDVSPATGSPNTLDAPSGLPLLWQRCGNVAAPEILDGSVPIPGCEPTPRSLGPLLEYLMWLTEVEPIE